MLHSKLSLHNSPQTQSTEGLKGLRSIFKGKKSQARRAKKDYTVLLMLFVYRKVVNRSMTKVTLSRQTNSMRHIYNLFISPSGITLKQ